MRLASAKICHGTVNNCITWNGAFTVFVTFMVYVALACMSVFESEWVGGRLQPQLRGNGVTSHALNYCTFVAGRLSAANCLWADQTANISGGCSARSPTLIHSLCLFPEYLHAFFFFPGALSPICAWVSTLIHLQNVLNSLKHFQLFHFTTTDLSVFCFSCIY